MSRTHVPLVLSFALVSSAWGPFDAVERATQRTRDAQLGLDRVVDEVQATYDETTSFSGRFRQSAYQVALGETRVSQGTVAFLKPGRMVWDYEGAPGEMGRMLILDGRSLWSIDLQREQYYTAPLDSQDVPAAVRFLAGEGDLRGDFDVTLLAPPRDDRAVLQLVPKAASSEYARLLLVVRTDSWRIVETTVVDALGNSNTLQFVNLAYNGEVEESLFTVEVPAGFTRIDVPDGG